VVVGPFTAEMLTTYADISGDSNPLHLDSSVARSLGFSACPVHGMLLLSLFEQFLRDWRDDLFPFCMRGQFLTPVLVGESVILSGRVAKVEAYGGSIVGVIRLIANTQNDALALMGEARVSADGGQFRVE